MVAQILREALEGGAMIEIDGLGTFQCSSRNGFVFRGRRGAKIFIAYVVEDAPTADRLFTNLANHGFDPWMDRKKLLPGQNWPRAIEHAIETTDFVALCFSHHSVRKKGGFQAEIRYALDCAARLPLDQVFLVPVRLDDCDVPPQIRRTVQYVDLFPDFELGLRKVLQVLNVEWRKRRSAVSVPVE